MASNFVSSFDNETFFLIEMFHRLSAMFISSVALDELWVDATLPSLLTNPSYQRWWIN